MKTFVGFNNLNKPLATASKYGGFGTGVYIDPSQIAAVVGFDDVGGKWCEIHLKAGGIIHVLGDPYHAVIKHIDQVQEQWKKENNVETQPTS